MGTFQITFEIGDQSGQRFQELEVLVDTGATFTKVPRSILEALGIPPERTYTALLADGRRVPREQGWTTIRLEGHQFPTAGRLRRRRGANSPRRHGLGTRTPGCGPPRTKAHPRRCPGDDQHERMNGENPAGDKTAKKRMQGRRRPDERGPSLSGSTPQTPPKPTPPRQETAPSPLTKPSTGTDEIGPPRHQPSEPRKKKFCTMNRT